VARKKAAKTSKKKLVEPSFVSIDDSRVLVTIKSDSEIWKSSAILEEMELGGSIVRLIPPATATDLQIEELKVRCTEMGAVAVKPLPRQQLGKAGEQDDPKRIASKDLRAAVLEVADRMATDDKTALLKELNFAMDEAGI
jgi:hypothetical protein